MASATVSDCVFHTGSDRPARACDGVRLGTGKISSSGEGQIDVDTVIGHIGDGGGGH